MTVVTAATHSTSARSSRKEFATKVGIVTKSSPATAFSRAARTAKPRDGLCIWSSLAVAVTIGRPVNSAIKYTGAMIEYLDQRGLHPGFVMREQGDKLVIRDHLGHERTIARELVMMRHGAAHAEGDGDPAARIAALEEEKARLRADLDLTLLW